MQVFPTKKMDWGRCYGFVCGARENLSWMAEGAIQGGKFGDLVPSDVCYSRGDLDGGHGFAFAIKGSWVHQFRLLR